MPTDQCVIPGCDNPGYHVQDWTINPPLCVGHYNAELRRIVEVKGWRMPASLQITPPTTRKRRK